MDEGRQWFAVYTKPRWEKKVHRLFTEKGIISYCPLNRVRRQWSDRVKTVQEPLFKSYVFVHIDPLDQTPVRMVAGVINFVYWQGKLARIRDEEIDLIRKFTAEYEDVEAVALDIRPQDQVVINKGVLLGQTGRVSKLIHQYAEVVLDSLGYKLIAKFEKKSLARLPRA